MTIADKLKGDQGRTFLVAAGVASVAAVVVFSVLSRELDRRLGLAGEGLVSGAEAQLRASIQTQLQTQVPPMVRTEVVRKLTEYGITPTTGRRLDRALAAVERLGWL